MDNRYIHLGVGVSGIRSYSLGICKCFTSTCLVNSKYRELHKIYVASHVDYVIRKFIDNLDILKNPFHTYRSRDRTYYVYKYSDKLWSLLKQIFMFAEFIHSNKKLRYRKREIVENVLSKCRDVDRCIDSIIDTVNRLEFEIRKRRERGKKALLSRFENNNKKCLHIIKKYFSDLENTPTFKVSGIGFAECFEDTTKILRKMFPDDVASRYANSICAGGNSIYLFARDSIIAIDARYSNHDVKIFCDSCIDTPGYAMVKLVGVSMINGYVDRVDWIAVLGYDKHSNQIFLHYVPKTLVFRDAEVCRRWIMGLADNYGNTDSDVEIIEV